MKKVKKEREWVNPHLKHRGWKLNVETGETKCSCGKYVNRAKPPKNYY